MSKHRNPRPRLPKHPSTHNPPRRPTCPPALSAVLERLARENPTLASAVLRALGVIAGADRRQAMLLIEAVSAIVLHSPKTAPDDGSEAL